MKAAAAQHVVLAADTAARVPVGVSAGCGQATAGAVSTANALVAKTAAVLGVRLATTGRKVGTVGVAMAEHDDVSARQIDAVYPTVGL